MNRKELLAFSISFLLLIAVTVINRVSFDKVKEFTGWVDHTRQVITALEELSNGFKSAQIYSASFAPEDNAFYEMQKADALTLKQEVNTIRYLVRDNPVQVKRVDSIGHYIEEQYSTLLQKNIIEILRSDEKWRLKKILEVHQLINRGIQEETNLLATRKADLARSTQLNSVASILFSIVAVAILVVTFLSNFFLTRKRRWLEGFLASVLNTSQNGIITFKAIRSHRAITDFKVEYANNTLEPLMGLKPKNIEGKLLSQLPALPPELLSHYTTVVTTGRPQEFEMPYYHNGVEKWFVISLVKRSDGLTATFHDITKIKNYETDLKQNIEQLEHSNSELEQYAYVASHDLQEPLRKIKTFASMLQEGQKNRLDEAGTTQVNKIVGAADRMSVLIKDVLNFSSLKRAAHFVPTNLDDVLKNVLQDLELVINQKSAVIKTDALPVIDAIPLQMNQLFYNLVNNALKFTKTDVQPIVTIKCSKATVQEIAEHKTLLPHTEYCKIVVEDNGVGFDQKFAEQIFGLFKRLNDRHSFSGSGIGLALCRKVVINHNGIIYAQSAEGKGASFFVLLPLHQKQINDTASA